MDVGYQCLLLSLAVSSAVAALVPGPPPTTTPLPQHSGGSGLMVGEDGRPRALPLIPPPVEGNPPLQDMRLSGEAARYAQELLSQPMKLASMTLGGQGDLTRLMQEMMQWRSQAFPASAMSPFPGTNTPTNGASSP